MKIKMQIPFLLKFLQIAVRNLFRRKVRTVILASAIIVVTLILIITSALVGGVEKSLFSVATTLFSGHINISGFYKISSSSSAPMVIEYPALLSITKQLVPEASLIIDRVKGWGKVVSEKNSIQAPLWGIDLPEEKQMISVLNEAQAGPSADGTEAAAGDFRLLTKRGGIVLFKEQAKKLKVVVGDMVTLFVPTNRNINNTKDLKVISILKNVGHLSNFFLFIHKDDLRELYQMKANSTGQLMIYLKDERLRETVYERLRKLLPNYGYQLLPADHKPFWLKFDQISSEPWIGQKLDLTTWKDEISTIDWILSLFNTLFLSFIVILIILIMIGLITALWMSVHERSSEIGTLRSIGMQKSAL
ncbi:MAG: ABC transporter permease, partial [Oligoflexia bacterium]|nr:ABC transporter permease [Oligoflexia bacterium]